MNFIHKENKTYPVSLVQLRAEHPLTLFPEDFAEDFGDYAFVHPVTAPEINPGTQTIQEGKPEKDGEVWLQTWEVKEKSPAEVDEYKKGLVPTSCTPAQGYVALFVLKNITKQMIFDAVDNIADPVQKYTAQIGLEYTGEWRLESTTMQVMAELLGLSNDDLCDLFTYAASVHI